jgi:hypothetical protein
MPRETSSRLLSWPLQPPGPCRGNPLLLGRAGVLRRGPALTAWDRERRARAHEDRPTQRRRRALAARDGRGRRREARRTGSPLSSAGRGRRRRSGREEACGGGGCGVEDACGGGGCGVEDAAAADLQAAVGDAVPPPWAPGAPTAAAGGCCGSGGCEVGSIIVQECVGPS